MMMKWLAALMTLLFLSVPALAEEDLYPALEDGLDRAVQQLAVMSQRDEAFEHVAYNGGQLQLRGCLPR